MPDLVRSVRHPEGGQDITVQQVRTQLKRLVDSPPFRSSKRYPRFLTYIVEKELAGAFDELKERLIGIEVFDRAPDYDHTSDPCVRVAASEIRKRLAQYYIQPGCERELRIELQTGAYVPSYYWPPQTPPLPASEEGYQNSRPQAPAEEAAAENTPRRRARLAIALLIALGSCIVLGGIYLYWRATRLNALDTFWAPLVQSRSTTLVCVGNKIPSEGPDVKYDAGKSFTELRSESGRVGPNDALALGRVTGILGRQNHAFTVEVASYTTLSELHSQPAVLIGAMTNEWTSRLLADQRFKFVSSSLPNTSEILDTAHQERHDWSFDAAVPVNQVFRDYAVVDRYVSHLTGQPVIVIAGLGPYGTNAASEFVSNPQYFREFTQKAPRDWDSHDVEIVLATEVIDGRSGAPHVVTFALH